MKWFLKSWWIYLLKPSSDYYKTSLWTAFKCRVKGHEGIIFYDPSGLESNFHCKNCGDDLG